MRDEGDFEALFAHEFPRVARVVHHVVGDRARAEEITQDAFVELLRHWRTVVAYDRPDLWLRRVAIRKAQRERRRGWRGRELEALAAPPEVVGPPPTPAPEVLEAVRRLAPGQRAVVVLFYLEDRPMTEIAEILGIRESTGWSQLHTARKHLAQALRSEVSDA
ncbi:RNA polymerase sigma-70 factor, ECF subfamily [Nocardioides alpinus]|nr:sigma factor-like helix-turn-helix DNA-binding protein [Nocardioides alpinus]SFB27178.1 RNA polymerase sigma-70 factor, ECF subfamily [Nocardioides alpinus]